MLNLPHTFQINYSELSRKYGAAEKSKMGNMVVKEFKLKGWMWQSLQVQEKMLSL